MKVDRVPLIEEPIAGTDTVESYDRDANLYMVPEYKYFVWKILRRGIRNGRILDVGTGTGRLAIELAKANLTNFEIIGLDISDNMLIKARENAVNSGVANKIELILAPAAVLPFPDESFDMVMSYASLHHWLRPVEVFNEMQRVIKPEGSIIVRDNRRVYGNKLWETFIWAFTRFTNKHHRDTWSKAILASYTVPEVRTLLKESKLRNYDIGTDFIKFDVCVEIQRKLSQSNY
jgi:ubiquinone/menaquinone biosynthesis C-methylase UbiE